MVKPPSYFRGKTIAIALLSAVAGASCGDSSSGDANQLLSQVNEAYRQGIEQPHETTVIETYTKRFAEFAGEDVFETRVYRIVQEGERAAMEMIQNDGQGGIYWQQNPDTAMHHQATVQTTDGDVVVETANLDLSQFDKATMRHPQLADEIPEEAMAARWEYLPGDSDFDRVIDDKEMLVVWNLDTICWNADSFSAPGTSVLWIDPDSFRLRRIASFLDWIDNDPDEDPLDIPAHSVSSNRFVIDIQREEVDALEEADFESIMQLPPFEEFEDKTQETLDEVARNRALYEARCQMLTDNYIAAREGAAQ